MKRTISKRAMNAAFLGFAIAASALAVVSLGADTLLGFILFAGLTGLFVYGLVANNEPVNVRRTPLTERRWEPGGKP